MAPAGHCKVVDLIGAAPHYLACNRVGETVMAHNESERLEQALETVDTSRREALRKLVATSAFAVPVVVSFAVSGLTVSSALAVPLNSSTS